MRWTREKIAAHYNAQNVWLPFKDINVAPSRAKIKPFEWSQPAFYHDLYDVTYRWSGSIYTMILKKDVIAKFVSGTNKPAVPSHLFSWDYEFKLDNKNFELLIPGGQEVKRGVAIKRSDNLSPFYARVLALPEGDYVLTPEGYLDGDKG